MLKMFHFLYSLMFKMCPEVFFWGRSRGTKSDRSIRFSVREQWQRELFTGCSRAMCDKVGTLVFKWNFTLRIAGTNQDWRALYPPYFPYVAICNDKEHQTRRKKAAILVTRKKLLARDTYHLLAPWTLTKFVSFPEDSLSESTISKSVYKDLMKSWMESFSVASRHIISFQYIVAMTRKKRNLIYGTMNPTLCNIIHLEATVRFAVRLSGENPSFSWSYILLNVVY